MERPRLLPTSARDESFAGITYHLEGELVPVLTVELPARASVYFEHHILLWKHPTVDIGLRLHGYGNVFEKVLGPGESIDVEPGGWLYKDTQVTMAPNATRLSTGILAGTSLVLNRFTGPGRIGLQSMYVHLPSE